MSHLDELQKRIRSLADTVNAFKSEAVQLRVVDVLLGHLGIVQKIVPELPDRARKKVRPRSRATAVEKPAKAERRAKASSTAPGAHAMISRLLDEGFFRSGKTIGDIVEHCSSSRGHHYKANECSPALLRLLRDERLRRKKNKDGQYEYTQA